MSMYIVFVGILPFRLPDKTFDNIAKKNPNNFFSELENCRRVVTESLQVKARAHLFCIMHITCQPTDISSTSQPMWHATKTLYQSAIANNREDRCRTGLEFVWRNFNFIMRISISFECELFLRCFLLLFLYLLCVLLRFLVFFHFHTFVSRSVYA